MVPEGVVLSPDAVVEWDVLLAKGGGSRWEPHNVGECCWRWGLVLWCFRVENILIEG